MTTFLLSLHYLSYTYMPGIAVRIICASVVRSDHFCPCINPSCPISPEDSDFLMMTLYCSMRYSGHDSTSKQAMLSRSFLNWSTVIKRILLLYFQLAEYLVGQLGSGQTNATQCASGCYYIGNHLRTLLEPSRIYTSNIITIAQELSRGLAFGPRYPVAIVVAR